ncbi:hypothetical protein JCGZ_10704 [Jatropha curcas]|uniref:Cytochrome P450 n=1 Tax=Jatropha curcas TaxID=180498 RepID=A0A067KSB9_JATCU|nr:hypothetical protein JCGZ_10704 [Jatropha curcas]
METLQVTYISSCTACVILLSFLIKFFNKVWGTPMRIQSMMRSQGIKGPSYKLFYGNTKEILRMNKKALTDTKKELSSHQVFPTILPHLHSWMKLYGKNFLWWEGAQAFLEISEPNLIKDMMENRYGVFHKPIPDDYNRKLLGDGIAITRVPEKWLKLRKISNHAFHAECLKNMFPAMITSVEMMIERWKHHEGKEHEVFQEFILLSSEIISRTAFGSSYLEGQRIFDMLTQLIFIIDRNKYRIRIPGIRYLVKNRDDIESDKIDIGIHNAILNMIKKREEEAMMSQSNGFGSDFLGILLKAHHDNNDSDETNRISVEEIIDDCKIFYAAGQGTVATSLTWTLYLLSIHTDWQEKARKEVFELFGQKNPSPDSLSKLKIVSMIYNEALRLYPPILTIAKEALREVKIGNLVVPANTVVEVPVVAVHHDPEIWGEDVYLFKPERFAEGLAKATNNNVNGYLPFSLGPRHCVGDKFALTEAKITLSMILQHFRFNLSPNYVHSPIPLLTIYPEHGMKIMFHPLQV